MSKGEKVKLSSIVQATITGEWGTECTNEKICTKVLRTTNFTNSGVINYSNVVLRNIPEQKRNAKRLIDQDIILEKSGGSDTQPVGRVVFFSDKSDEVYLCNNFTQILRIDQSKAYPKYIFWHLYYLHSIGTTEALQNKTTGIRNLQIKRYMAQEIHLPPLSVQKNITHRLEHINSLIDMRKEQIDKLNSLVKSQFIEMFGDPLVSDSQWITMPLKTVCKSILGGGTPSKRRAEYYLGDIPWVTPKDMKSLIIDDSQDHITEEAILNSTTKLVPTGSVLMVIRSGILKHTLPVAINTKPVTINQDMKAFVPKANIVAEYLLYFFKSIDVEVLGKVRSFTADNIDFKEFQKRNIPVPPVALQNRFAEFSQRIDETKLAIQKSLVETETLKQALMQQYFS